MTLTLSSAAATLQRFDGNFDALSKALTPSLAAVHAELPTYLFHYTSTDGVLGIVQSERIWATNTSFLNDRSEVEYAAELVKEVLDAADPTGPDEVELISRMRETFNGFELGMWGGYVACFCESGDLLSQWRGYGRAGSWAVGLHAREIGAYRLPTTRTVAQEFALRKVQYDRGIQLELVTRVVKETRELFRFLLQQVSAAEEVSMLIARFCGFLRFQLTELLLCLKHPGFSEEQEWRAIAYVVGSAGAPVRFRARGADIVPFVELDISPGAGLRMDRMPIAKIVHGPQVQPALAEAAVKILLKAKDMRDVDIIGSTIPYSI